MYFFQSASAAVKSSCCSASSARSEYNSASDGEVAISLVNSARVSLGGRPHGARKKTVFQAAARRRCSRPNSSTRRAAPRRNRSQTAAPARILGKDFNFHLPAADVVREILRRHRHLVPPRRQRRGNHHLASVRSHLRVPSQIHRRSAVHPGDDGPRGIRRAHAHLHRFAAMKLRPVELHFHRRRLARDHEGLRFAKTSPVAVAQNQAHVIRAVGQILRREKPRLPGVFVAQVAQLLYRGRTETSRSPT